MPGTIASRGESQVWLTTPAYICSLAAWHGNAVDPIAALPTHTGIPKHIFIYNILMDDSYSTPKMAHVYMYIVALTTRTTGSQRTGDLQNSPFM